MPVPTHANSMGQALYPEAAMPFNTRAGVENVSGSYVDTAGVLLFVWSLLPQGTDYSQPYVTPLNAPSQADLPNKPFLSPPVSTCCATWAMPARKAGERRQRHHICPLSGFTTREIPKRTDRFLIGSDLTRSYSFFRESCSAIVF